MSILYGLAGTFASGKDTLAEWLEHNGFVHVSTSDLVRLGAREKYGSDDRKYLFDYANERRKADGAAVFFLSALDQMKSEDKVAISGIRTVGEVEELKKAGGTLVFVDAPVELRYIRAHKRSRDAADESLESFKQSEQKELSRPRSNKDEQNIGAVKELADIILLNDADLGTFFAEATAMLKL